MKKYLVFILLLSYSFFSYAQKKIVLEPIPEKLLHKANAVLREVSWDITIDSPTDITIKRKRAVTVLNEKGEKYASFSVNYGRFEKIVSLSAALYDANGKRVNKYKEKDFYDQAAVSSGTLFSDARFKSLSVSRLSYPYTIVYEAELKWSSSLFLPSWLFKPAEDVSYMYDSYTVRAKDGLKINVKETNFEEKGIRAQEDGYTVYHWDVKNLPTSKAEALSVPDNEIYPMVQVALNSFEVDDYPGSFESWKTYGSWSYELNKDRQKLPQEAIDEVKKLTAGITDPKAKAKKVYEYMQGRTRYVNVAIGIGGWQPFPAETVHKNGYGDCKALTNYTKSLLAAVGIPSVYSLISAGRYEGDIMIDFPSQQFDHVILCVPLEKDTVWLECTSQQIPFGFLGDFTDNRHALLVTEEGGKLVRTPSYEAGKSISAMHLQAELDANGKLSGAMETEHTGLAYDKNMHYLSMKPTDRKKSLQRRISMPMLDLQRIEYSETRDMLPKMQETIGFVSEKYATMSAGRMFLEVNPTNKVTYIPERIRKRKTDFEYRRGRWDKDVVEIQLPAEYQVEYPPKTYSIETEFGSYKTSVEIKEGKLVYRREFKLSAGRHKAEKWNSFRDFFEQVKKADETKLVLQKKG